MPILSVKHHLHFASRFRKNYYTAIVAYYNYWFIVSTNHRRSSVESHYKKGLISDEVYTQQVEQKSKRPFIGKKNWVNVLGAWRIWSARHGRILWGVIIWICIFKMVQSYGSCQKPDYFWRYRAQRRYDCSLTKICPSANDKDCKRNATGPITMLQWSFVRDDQPRLTAFPAGIGYP